MRTKVMMVVSLFCVSVGLLLTSVNKENTKHRITIGILIPMEHAAIREIVAGFKETVSKKFSNDVIFNVQCAEGDIKLKRSILELFIGKNTNLIVPIGTGAAEMTLSIVKKQPIVSLAAQYTENQRLARTPRNITGVSDEIGFYEFLNG